MIASQCGTRDTTYFAHAFRNQFVSLLRLVNRQLQRFIIHAAVGQGTGKRLTRQPQLTQPRSQFVAQEARSERITCRKIKPRNRVYTPMICIRFRNRQLAALRAEINTYLSLGITISVMMVFDSLIFLPFIDFIVV